MFNRHSVHNNLDLWGAKIEKFVISSEKLEMIQGYSGNEWEDCDFKVNEC